MMHEIEPGSLYELLGVSASASREEIDQACVNLWYRYQSMRNTPLWADLSRHIDDIHATLLDPDARLAYDKMLAKNQPGGHSGSLWAHQQAAHIALRGPPRIKFRKIGYGNAVSTALIFNKMIDWINPENWSDIGTIAWLTLFFGLATTLLCWCGYTLLGKQQRPPPLAKK